MRWSKKQVITVANKRFELLNWREFGAESAPLIKSMFEDKPYPGIDKIIRYLEAGKPHLSSPGVGVDVFTGEQVMNHYDIRDDGEYSWCSMLSYYVKKYNMRLPKDFEDKVLKGHDRIAISMRFLKKYATEQKSELRGQHSCGILILQKGRQSTAVLFLWVISDAKQCVR